MLFFLTRYSLFFKYLLTEHDDSKPDNSKKTNIVLNPFIFNCVNFLFTAKVKKFTSCQKRVIFGAND